MKKQKYVLAWALAMAIGLTTFAQSGPSVGILLPLIGENDKNVDKDIPPDIPPVQLSVDELKNSPSELKLFPNPCQEFLTISSLTNEGIAGEIRIYSITGREVKKLSLAPGDRGEIPLADLNQGIYFLTYQGRSYKFHKI